MNTDNSKTGTGTDSDDLPPPLGTGSAAHTTGGMPQTLDSGAARTTADAGSDGIDGADADISSDVDADHAADAASAADRLADAGDQQPRTPRPR